jgi:predicted GNAT family acetyltransferase
MELTHHENARRFVLPTPHGDAVLEYTRTADEISITHTFVPSELRGQGVADKLMRAAIAWAREQRLHVTASCSYAAIWLERHPAEPASPGRS